MFRLIVFVGLASFSLGFPEKLAPSPATSSQYLPPSNSPSQPYVITAPVPFPEPEPSAPGGQYGAPPPPVNQYPEPTGGEPTPKPPVVCDTGLLPDPYGNCVEPEVVRDLYVFQEPADEDTGAYEEPLPPPQVKLNLVVIRTNDDDGNEEPIIIPPPQEKTLVLVLSKKGDTGKQIIEIPAREGQKPEVFFVDYAEGDNTMLPGGIYLQDALQYAASAPGESGHPGSPGGPDSPGGTQSEYQPPSPYF